MSESPRKQAKLENPRAFQVRLDNPTYEALRTYASATHESMNSILNSSVTAYLTSPSASQALAAAPTQDPVSAAQEAIRQLGG